MKSVLSAVRSMADKGRLDESAGCGRHLLGAMGFECREPPTHVGHDGVLGRSNGRRGWRVGVAGWAGRGDRGHGGRHPPGWERSCQQRRRGKSRWPPPESRGHSSRNREQARSGSVRRASISKRHDEVGRREKEPREAVRSMFPIVHQVHLHARRVSQAGRRRKSPSWRRRWHPGSSIPSSASAASCGIPARTSRTSPRSRPSSR
jgi:hypothetical protein